MFTLITNPNRSLNTLDQFFERAWNWDDHFFGTKNSMETDILETEKGYLLQIDMPRIKKENISISYENNYLKVSAEEKETKQADKYILQERSYKKYSRSFYAPNINSEGIKAKLEDGVLSIEVPRKIETENTKKITIE